MKKHIAHLGWLLMTVLAGCHVAPRNRQLLVEPWPRESVPVSDAAVSRFAQVLRFETTNDQLARANVAAFVAQQRYLQQAFPLVHAKLERELVGELSLLYRWPGADESLPAVLFLAHQDVVPVQHPGAWTISPFAGEIVDGVVHGRGAVDNKFALTGLLEAAEWLLERGTVPRQTIYFAFGHDEEIMGTRGALKIAQLLAKRGVRCQFVLDEGPAVVAGLVPGLSHQVAFIGTSAKGQAYFRLSTKGPGGHGAIPPRETPISVLARGITRLYAHDYPFELPRSVQDTFAFLAPAMPFASRLAFANPWLFKPLLIKELEKSSLSRALITETIAATVMRAGDKDATVPSHAEAVVNVGFLPGRTIQDAKRDIEAILDDERIQVGIVEFPDNNFPHAYDPTPTASAEGKEFLILQRTAHEVFPAALVAPTLMPSGSDGKHFLQQKVTDLVYYFDPVDITADMLKALHGDNERLPVESYKNAVRFYVRLIQNLAADQIPDN